MAKTVPEKLTGYSFKLFKKKPVQPKPHQPKREVISEASQYISMKDYKTILFTLQSFKNE